LNTIRYELAIHALSTGVSLCDKGADGHIDARGAALYAGLTAGLKVMFMPAALAGVSAM
jgi:hypothetical protein